MPASFGSWTQRICVAPFWHQALICALHLYGRQENRFGNLPNCRRRSGERLWSQAIESSHAQLIAEPLPGDRHVSICCRRRRDFLLAALFGPAGTDLIRLDPSGNPGADLAPWRRNRPAISRCPRTARKLASLKLTMLLAPRFHTVPTSTFRRSRSREFRRIGAKSSGWPGHQTAASWRDLPVTAPAYATNQETGLGHRSKAVSSSRSPGPTSRTFLGHSSIHRRQRQRPRCGI